MPIISPTAISPHRIGGRGGIDWSSYWTQQNTEELITYTAGLTTPLSNDQKYRLTAFVKALKMGLSITDLSDAFDCLWIDAGETSESSLRNLVKDAHHATLVNAPSFEAFGGFTGNGINSYQRLNYNPYMDGVTYTVNSASYGFYSKTNKQETTAEMGLQIAAAHRNYALIRHSSNDRLFYVNTGGAAITENDLATDSLGFYIINRSASNASALYRNKTDTFGGAVASVAGLPDIEWYGLAINNGGSPALLSTRQVSMKYIGRAFNEDERAVIVDAFEEYLSLFF